MTPDELEKALVDRGICPRCNQLLPQQRPVHIPDLRSPITVDVSRVISVTSDSKYARYSIKGVGIKYCTSGPMARLGSINNIYGNVFLYVSRRGLVNRNCVKSVTFERVPYGTSHYLIETIDGEVHRSSRRSNKAIRDAIKSIVMHLDEPVQITMGSLLPTG